MNHAKRTVLLGMLLVSAVLTGTACGRRATTMQLVKTEGEVGVMDEKGKSMDIFEEMGLYSGYHVDTQAKSQAWINLDSTKLTRMDEESQVEVKGDKGKLEMVVHSGRLFFHVTEPLPDGETLEIRTSTMLVGIRGTCGWIEVPEENHMKVYLIEGTVECRIEPTGQAEETTALLSGGEMADMMLLDGRPQITVTSYGSREIPDFVLEEISGNESLISEIDQIRIRGFLSEMEDALAAKDYDRTLNLVRSEEYSALAPLIQADAPRYSDSRDGSGAQNGVGIIAYNNDIFYYGARENGIRSGQGIAFMAIDQERNYGYYPGEYSVYDGNWANDMPNGQGREFTVVSPEKIMEYTGLFTLQAGEFTDGLFNGRMDIEETLWDGTVHRYYGTARNGVWDLLDGERHYLVNQENGEPSITIDEGDNQMRGISWLL